MQVRTVALSRPLSLKQTLGVLRRGAVDPTMLFDGVDCWRASRTPEGSATVALRVRDTELIAHAWGPGAEWALDKVPQLIGENQPGCGIDMPDRLVRELSRRFEGLRVPRTDAVFEALVPSVIEQRVTGREAVNSYARLVRALGERAPGPVGGRQLWVAPTAECLAGTPSWALHKFGIERKRAEVIRVISRCVRRLDEMAGLEPLEAMRRLQTIPGIGPWTSAEVAYRALGAADAVSVGDYHFPDIVSWALAGEPRGDDSRMLELLEPYRGHRGWVLRMIVMGGPRPPKWGPRYSPLPIAAF